MSVSLAANGWSEGNILPPLRLHVFRDCVNRLRAPVSPTQDRKTLLFPSCTDQANACQLSCRVRTGQFRQLLQHTFRNTNIRHETICIQMVRVGTLLVSGQNSNVQNYVQGKTNNSHSHGLSCLTIASLTAYSDTNCWPTRRGERSRA